MWQCIEQTIKAETGHRFVIEKKRIIAASDTNLSYKVSDCQHNYFVKIKDKNHFNQFESEAYALDQIRSLKQVTCPEVISTGTTLDKSFIVLSYIPFSQPTNENWHHLGAQLAMMHKNSSHGQFGWQHDNYIG
ncbi:MAG: fructosamine kinase family protein, partial [Colwellia sp.]